jgi:hypothetical protein
MFGWVSARKDNQSPMAQARRLLLAHAYAYTIFVISRGDEREYEAGARARV